MANPSTLLILCESLPMSERMKALAVINHNSLWEAFNAKHSTNFSEDTRKAVLRWIIFNENYENGRTTFENAIENTEVEPTMFYVVRDLPDTYESSALKPSDDPHFMIDMVTPMHAAPLFYELVSMPHPAERGLSEESESVLFSVAESAHEFGQTNVQIAVYDELRRRLADQNLPTPDTHTMKYGLGNAIIDELRRCFRRPFDRANSVVIVPGSLTVTVFAPTEERIKQIPKEDSSIVSLATTKPLRNVGGHDKDAGTVCGYTVDERLVVDGIDVETDTKILVMGEDDPSRNGVYTVVNSGEDYESAWILQRVPDAETGRCVFSMYGIHNAASCWYRNNDGTYTEKTGKQNPLNYQTVEDEGGKHVIPNYAVEHSIHSRTKDEKNMVAILTRDELWNLHFPYTGGEEVRDTIKRNFEDVIKKHADHVKDLHVPVHDTYIHTITGKQCIDHVGIVANIIEDCFSEDDCCVCVIPNATPKELRKVIEFARNCPGDVPRRISNQHQHIIESKGAADCESAKVSDEVSQEVKDYAYDFVAKYFSSYSKKKKDAAFRTVNMADYLGARHCCDALICVIATWLEGRIPEEICATMYESQRLFGVSQKDFFRKLGWNVDNPPKVKYPTKLDTKKKCIDEDVGIVYKTMTKRTWHPVTYDETTNQLMQDGKPYKGPEPIDVSNPYTDTEPRWVKPEDLPAIVNATNNGSDNDNDNDSDDDDDDSDSGSANENMEVDSDSDSE